MVKSAKKDPFSGVKNLKNNHIIQVILQIGVIRPSLYNIREGG
jgi:hypothetical protein